MSGQQRFYNSISSTLAAGTPVGGTTLTVSDAVFPSVAAPDFYLAALEAVGGGTIEIIKVVAVTGTTLTVERAQEGSTGAAYNSGDTIQIRNTAGSMDRLGQKSDEGAAFPFQTTVVTSALVFYIDPTGDDTSGDGSLGSPWASLYKALGQAQYLRFGPAGSLTIQCADGTYPMSAQLVFDHPQGDKITVTGDPGSFTFPSGIVAVDYSNDREAPVTSPRAPTEVHNTAGVCPYSTTPVARETLRASDAASNRTFLQSTAGPIFDWSAGGAQEPKVSVQTHARILYANFSFPIDSGTTRPGFSVSPNQNLYLANVSINAGTNGVLCQAESTLTAESLVITGTRADAIVASDNASVVVTGAAALLIQGSAGNGLALLDGSVLTVEDGGIHAAGNGGRGANILRNTALVQSSSGGEGFLFTGNVGQGVVVSEGLLKSNANGVTVEGNVSPGAAVSNNSVLACASLRAVANSIGVDCTFGSIVRAFSAGSNIENNVGVGVQAAEYGVVAYGGAASIKRNGSHAISLDHGAGVVAASTLTITGNTGQVFRGNYAGKCSLGALVCDLTNVATPHLIANGGTAVESVAPGSGGVDAGIQYSPPFNSAAVPPDTSFFSDITL